MSITDLSREGGISGFDIECTNCGIVQNFNRTYFADFIADSRKAGWKMHKGAEDDELGLGTSYRRLKSEGVRARMRLSKGGLNEDENKWLSENFNKYTNREIAEHFRKSERFIEKQLRRLELKKDFKARGWKWRKGHPRGMSGKHHSLALKKKVSSEAIERWKNPDSYLNSSKYRQGVSDRMFKLQKSGVLGTGYSRTKGGRRADLGGLYVRSGWEANYARYLNWMKGRGEIKEWFYESNTFDFPIKRGTRSYTPDFRVIENNGDIAFHEVKGWMTDKSRTALDRMRRYHPEIKIVLIGEKEYRALSKWKSMIPNWEGK